MINLIGKECYNMTINTKNDNTFESQLFSITTIIRSYLIIDGKTYSWKGNPFLDKFIPNRNILSKHYLSC